MKICLDPGHGGIPSHGGDTGALGFRNTLARQHDPACAFVSPTEANLNTVVGHILATELAALGHEIELTRNADDQNPSLPIRAQTANHWGADVFLSVHHNSADDLTANGFEVLHYPGSKGGAALAYGICKAVAESFPDPTLEDREENAFWADDGAWPYRVRGPKPRGDLYVLKHTVMPAVLIEVGFISNRFEETICNLPEFQQRMSHTIARAVNKWRVNDG